jgi:hypothetical protein
MKLRLNLLIVTNLLIAAVAGYLLFLSWASNIQESHRRNADELALERCPLLNPSFTDAFVLDETEFCSGTFDGTSFAVPLDLVIQEMSSE